MSCFRSNLSYLTESVYSIVNQTLSEFEFLIWIDGELNEECRKFLHAVEAEDLRVTVVNSDIQVGLAKALNSLAEMSNAEFLARMDDDDVSEPTRLEAQLRNARSEKIAILGTDCVEINEQGQKIAVRSMPRGQHNIRSTLVWRNPIIHPSVMMRRSSFRELNGYDTTMSMNQDYDLWFRADKLGMRIENLPEPLIKWRRSKQAMGRRRFRRMWWDVVVKFRHRRRNPRLLPSLVLTIALRSLPPILLEFMYTHVRPGTKVVR